MKNKTLIVFALFISVSCLFCKNVKDQDHKQMESPMVVGSHDDNMNGDNTSMDHGLMEAMSMEKMKTMKMSGDFDLDFANMMILHHQSAIDMSQIEIAKGTDAEVKSMAQKMIAAQTAEISEFQRIINNYKPGATHDHKEMNSELNDSMNEMMNKMTNMKMTGNTDKDFVMMMIPHHEGALEMAESQLSQGHNAELKKMAQKIIVDQKKEISELRDWLAIH